MGRRFFVPNQKNIKTMKTLKTIWNKIPAWCKALIFMAVLGAPVINIVQGTALYNLQNNPGWGWGLLVAIPILFLFWQLVSRWSPFKKPEDVKISMRMNLKDSKVWSRMLGLILLTISMGVLVTELFDVNQDYATTYFEAFKEVGDATAVPLLFAIAVTAGIVEEVIFRGYIQNTLVRVYPKTISFLAIGLVFALIHYLPLPLLVGFILISVCFSLVADEFKSLGVVILAHALVDIISLAGLYYGTSEETSPQGLAIAAIVFIVSLLLIFKDNKTLRFSSLKKLKLQTKVQS